MVRIELYDLLSKTQEYIAKYYHDVDSYQSLLDIMNSMV